MKRKLALLAAAALMDAVVIWGVKSADFVVVIMPGVITTFSTIVLLILNALLALAVLSVLTVAGFRAAWGGGRRQAHHPGILLRDRKAALQGPRDGSA